MGGAVRMRSRSSRRCRRRGTSTSGGVRMASTGCRYRSAGAEFRPLHQLCGDFAAALTMGQYGYEPATAPGAVEDEAHLGAGRAIVIRGDEVRGDRFKAVVTIVLRTRFVLAGKRPSYGAVSGTARTGAPDTAVALIARLHVPQRLRCVLGSQRCGG